MEYHVWTGNDLFAMIFKEDDNGGVIGIADAGDPDPFSDTPIFSYCIVESVSIDGNLSVARRPATGRTHKKLVSTDYEYSGSASHIYLKLDELDQNSVFTRDQYLAIYFIFLSYMRSPTTNKEWHALRRCKASSFGINGKRDNGIAMCSASFMAEEYYSG